MANKQLNEMVNALINGDTTLAEKALSKVLSDKTGSMLNEDAYMDKQTSIVRDHFMGKYRLEGAQYGEREDLCYQLYREATPETVKKFIIDRWGSNMSDGAIDRLTSSSVRSIHNGVKYVTGVDMRKLFRDIHNVNSEDMSDGKFGHIDDDTINRYENDRARSRYVGESAKRDFSKGEIGRVSAEQRSQNKERTSNRIQKAKQISDYYAKQFFTKGKENATFDDIISDFKDKHSAYNYLTGDLPYRLLSYSKEAYSKSESPQYVQYIANDAYKILKKEYKAVWDWANSYVENDRAN